MAFQGDSIYWVEVEKIVPNPYQPRREFDEGKLHELAESVRMYGVLQPLTVTRREVSREDGTFYTEYELIAGERRLRASRLAGLAQVPVIIRTGEQSNQEKLELAIIENLQREDLNAVDRALAFKQLADQFKLSHSQVAKKVGRSREYVSNSLRLLNLPDHVLSALKVGDISEGHGRTLLMLVEKPEEQDTLFREIMLKKLSVREVERIARKIATDRVRKKDWGVDPVILDIEKRFTDTLGTRVQIQKTDFGGKVTIDYFTNDDLQKILALIENSDADTEGVVIMPGSDADERAQLAAATALGFIDDEPARTTDDVVSESPDSILQSEPSQQEQSEQPEQSDRVTLDYSPQPAAAPEASQYTQPQPAPAQPAWQTAPATMPAQEQYVPQQPEESRPGAAWAPAAIVRMDAPQPQPQPQPAPESAPQPAIEKAVENDSESVTIRTEFTTPVFQQYPSAPQTQPQSAPQEESARTPEPEQSDDDPNLYGMRHFSV